MLIFGVFVAYVLIGAYFGFTNAPYWERCFKYEGKSASALFSGMLWPLSPFFKFCFQAYKKAVEAEQKRVEREKEIADAEKELDA